MTVAATVVAALRSGRFAVADEAALQAAVEDVLRKAFGSYVHREVALRGSGSRIDFVVGDCSAGGWYPGAVGIELKVKGSRGDVLRQAMRYLGSAALESLVVASTSPQLLAGWPETLAGKPVATVVLRSWP